MADTAQASEALKQTGYSDRDIARALESIVGSEGFVNSPRLQDFLTYIVDESLLGRSDDITSKTIAVDVYQRELDSDDGAQNLVRVEARRLRRLLEDYYANEGSADPLKIEMEISTLITRYVALTS